MDSEVGGRGQLQELTECPVFIVGYAFGGHGILNCPWCKTGATRDVHASYNDFLK
jgi:hypothetical protein